MWFLLFFPVQLLFPSSDPYNPMEQVKRRRWLLFDVKAALKSKKKKQKYFWISCIIGQSCYLASLWRGGCVGWTRKEGSADKFLRGEMRWVCLHGRGGIQRLSQSEKKVSHCQGAMMMMGCILSIACSLGPYSSRGIRSSSRGGSNGGIPWIDAICRRRGRWVSLKEWRLGGASCSSEIARADHVAVCWNFWQSLFG